MVSFQMMYDDFNFSALNIRILLDCQRYTSYAANLFRYDNQSDERLLAKVKNKFYPTILDL